MNTLRRCVTLRAVVFAAAALACSVFASELIPPDAAKWRRDLTRNAQLEWGLNAPIATFAGQIHQESSWRANAASGAGAVGLAQFMPSTATWLSGVYATVGPADPSNPVWAMRAMVVYDRHLWERTKAADDCNRMAKVLSSYNGGLGWVQRDEYLAKQRGFDPSIWWLNVANVNNGRSDASWIENRTYPERILHTLEARYNAAGWGSRSCSG